MNSTSSKISVIVPLGLAKKRVREMLFRPFSMEKWIAIGFCAWLAELGNGSVSEYFNYSNRTNTRTSLHLEQIRDYVMHHLAWIVPTAIAGTLFVLLLMFLLIWVKSKGELMLLHCITQNSGEVSVPWIKFKKEALSLCCFCFLVALLSLLNLILLLAIMIWGIYNFSHLYHYDTSLLLQSLAPIGLSFFLVWIVLGLISIFTTHFVTPILYLQRGTCWEAWTIFSKLLRQHPWKFVNYLLFQLVIGLAIFFCFLIIILCTCCVGCLFLTLPFIGTVLALPIILFSRSYQLYYLAQYGAEFNIFTVSSFPPPLPI